MKWFQSYSGQRDMKKVHYLSQANEIFNCSRVYQLKNKSNWNTLNAQLTQVFFPYN
jgi:hypothetical protein